MPKRPKQSEPVAQVDEDNPVERAVRVALPKHPTAKPKSPNFKAMTDAEFRKYCFEHFGF
jgi:hypothetical protein